jgi:hypothetical protein
MRFAVQGQIVAAVERKSVADLVSSLTSGRLRYALGELSALPRAAVVIEDHYGQIFAVEHARGSAVADGLAELQIRWPMVPVVYCQTRKLAEEWTYRYLAAAHAWARDEPAARARLGLEDEAKLTTPSEPPPSTSELRAWARDNGLAVSDQTAAACDPRFTKHGARLTVLRAHERPRRDQRCHRASRRWGLADAQERRRRSRRSFGPHARSVSAEETLGESSEHSLRRPEGGCRRSRR